MRESEEARKTGHDDPISAELERLRQMEHDLTEVMETSPVEMFRQRIPAVVSTMAQVVVDNPGQIALVLAGTIVFQRVAINLVKPRTAVQTLALGVMLQVATPLLIKHATEKGWLKFKVRDEDGNLVPLDPADWYTPLPLPRKSGA